MPQLELLWRVLRVAIVEPGRQSLRGSEQLHVLGDKARVRVVIRLLHLWVSDGPVRLSGPQVVPENQRISKPLNFVLHPGATHFYLL